MNNATGTAMPNKINNHIDALKDALDTVPRENREQILEIIYKIEAASGRSNRILQFAQSAISDLRLQFKYLKFDLEATRRERDALAEQC